ncbi:MAG: c-type cytochrome biogenesis protein CcmI [Methylomonas sp.]
MNTLFWLILAGLLVTALLLLVLPLLKTKPLADADGEQRNLQIARQRLAELKQQLQDGILSEEQFDEQYLELQQSLNDDLDADIRPKHLSGSGRWVIWVLVLFLPLLSLFLYFLLGDANALQKAEQQQVAQHTAAKVQAMIAPLIERLKQNPDDAQGWMMLGRSYVYLQQYQNAADVFAQLNRHQPNNPEVMLNYADSLAMTRNGRLAGEPSTLIYKALQLDPNNKNALWLAGMAKMEEGDAAQAIGYWQKLAGLLPPDSEALPQVRQMIAEASAQQSSQPTAVAITKINVQVELDAAIKTKVESGQTIFIYAQALNGPKMPLAIVRKQVADLPLDVELNDTMAMQPGMHLADFKQLKIIARISKTGNASAQAGDFIGVAQIELPDDGQPKPVRITINQEVK